MRGVPPSTVSDAPYIPSDQIKAVAKPINSMLIHRNISPTFSLREAAYGYSQFLTNWLGLPSALSRPILNFFFLPFFSGKHNMLCTSWRFLPFLNDEYFYHTFFWGNKGIKVFGRLERDSVWVLFALCAKDCKPKLNQDHYDRIQIKFCMLFSEQRSTLLTVIHTASRTSTPFSSNHPSIHKPPSPFSLFPPPARPSLTRDLSAKIEKNKNK